MGLRTRAVDDDDMGFPSYRSTVAEPWPPTYHRHYLDIRVLTLTEGDSERPSPTEVATVDSSLRLYFTNAQVKEMNFHKLPSVNQPVKKVLAQHTDPKSGFPFNPRPLREAHKWTILAPELSSAT